MRKALIILSWVLLTSCSKAQDIPDVPSGYLYPVDQGVPGKKTYVCGERPFDTKGNLIASGDLAGQTKQVFENIKSSLSTVSMTLQDIIQIKYLVKGTSVEVGADTVHLLNNVGTMYFTVPPQIIDVKSVPKIVRDEVLIEIEVIAAK
ncbi:Rid family hydrolase [Spirosoma sp. KNUC1025]|uniref:Rid family hydrolase n=1 Tax=Spirosoma sp. KNUC1025 TaxID=2894082 RepID=UPI00386726DD|nr:RidA family protein [Spirosoma sp. KNUC1025]